MRWAMTSTIGDGQQNHSHSCEFKITGGDRMNQALEMARVAYQALDEKKGKDIRVIDISGISVIGDYFVITNGTSDSQVRALVDNVEEKMHKAGYELKEQEGNNSGTWVLLDYGDIIIHIFDRENRPFYNLERIWSDGKDVEMNNP